MKKILFLLCLIQNWIVFSQTETLVSPNGKKILFNPVFVNTADNGLTLIDNNVKLGGNLIKPTAITATTTNTLAFKGLQVGNSLIDNVVSTDATSNVLKTLSTILVTGPEPWYNVADNTPATSNTQDIYQIGNVGIGQSALTTNKLDVKSTIAGAIQIQDGTEKAGYVLKSNADGLGTWELNALASKYINGVLPSAPVNINGNMVVPRSTITLPTGTWVVFLGVKINPEIGFTTVPNSTYGARFTLSYSDTNPNVVAGFTFIDLNQIVYNFTSTGANPPVSPLFTTGCMRLTVTAPSVTLYLWNYGYPGASLASCGNDPENFFYAINVL